MFGALGQDLVGVPVGLLHDAADGEDIVKRHVLVEEVAHGVDEDPARLGPEEGLGQLVGDEAEVEALLVGMAGHAAKALGEGLGVAMGAAGADLGAAA